MFLNEDQRGKYASTLTQIGRRGFGTAELTAVLRPRVEDAAMPVSRLTITNEELALPLSWFDLDVYEREETLWDELEAVSSDYWWTLPQARMKFLNENSGATVEELAEGYAKLDVNLWGEPRNDADHYRQVALAMDFGPALLHWLAFITRGEVSAYSFLKVHMARTMDERLTFEEKKLNRDAWRQIAPLFLPQDWQK